MKCAKCGYDDNGTGDFAHVCEPGKIKLKPVMNKQTLKLAGQAGLYKDFAGTPWMQNLGYDATEQALAKFAELIVRECMGACGSVQEQFFNGRIATDDFNLKNRFAEGETACEMVKTKIEMIFGIK
jgi:hypothetical protein